jgi:hypothetical protein
VFYCLSGGNNIKRSQQTNGSPRLTFIFVSFATLLCTIAAASSPASATGLILSPLSAAFGNVVFGVTGATSAAKSVVITNPASGQPVTGLSVQLSGADPSEFAITNNGCAATLAKGTNCTVKLTFTPGMLGTSNASLAISDTANANAGSVTLSGVGIAGKLTITPLTWSFGSVLVGATSVAKTTTLKNLNKVALHIDTVTPSGDFAISSDTCSGKDLASAASCTIAAKFTPTQTGARSGSLNITDDALNSPQSVALSGTGTLANPTLAPTSIAFGKVHVGSVSPPKTVTVTNSNVVALSISSISATLPFNLLTNSCGSSIPAGGSCQVSLTFNPTGDSKTTGTTQTGKLTVSDNGKTPSQSVSLSGVAFGAPPSATPTATPTGTPTPSPTPTGTPTPPATEGISNIVTNQGHGTGKACDTTGDLAPGEFAQVSSDAAGQPCTANPGQGELGQKCDSTSVWNYIVRGHLTFGPPSAGTVATAIEVQTYVGGDGISCAGGATVSCSGSSILVEDATYPVGSLNETVPFAAAESLLAAYQSLPGDGNYQRFYVFVQPIGGSVTCTANNYVTEEHN